MMSNALILILGVVGGVLLYYGADFLVSGGVGIAKKLRIPNLIIGLTMVAFGTSAPELTVSIDAALRGKGDISVGNVVGSNICNIALILGLCAAVKALPVNRQVLKGDLPVMTLATLALAGLLYFTGGVPRWGGLIFILMMACYLAWLFISAKQSKEMQESLEGEISGEVQALWKSLLQFAGGLVALIFGAKYFVSGAVCAARLLSIPEAVIALTIVAIGTSLPELAASLIATKRGETDIAVGNIIGSNIWNILCIMGVSPLIRPIVLKDISHLDLAALLFISLSAIPILVTGKKVNRAEGVFWLLCYGVYMYLLFG
ncbi:MAG: calcium/sodium antiporter [Lentisphaeria bacterium]|nr:calcium/sodium antiporter [Lentisphaeria bacterium]